MKVLITGASGFLGREITNFLIEKKYEIIGIYNKNKIGNIYSDNSQVKYFQADLTDKKKLNHIIGDITVDVIIHCAGLAHQFGNTDKERFQRINVFGTENISKLAKRIGAKRFILISSVSVYGSQDSNPANMIGENHPCNPRDFYAESKLESEHICRKLCFENDINLSILRPATIIGEGDRGNVFRLINLINKGYFFWVGQGSNYKSLIYKKDVAQVCFEIIAKSDVKFEVFNLSAEPITMADIVNEISKTLGKSSKYIHLPESIPKLIFNLNRNTFKIEKLEKLEETIRKWKSNEVFSSRLIKDKYGFKPALTAREGIKLETESFCK